MGTTEHPRPTEPGSLVRVLFPIEEEGLGEAEAMWGKIESRGVCELRNIPLLVFGISLGDWFTADGVEQPLRFRRVIRHNGHSTYRVMV